jgi:hypothetical protein
MEKCLLVETGACAYNEEVSNEAMTANEKYLIGSSYHFASSLNIAPNHEFCDRLIVPIVFLFADMNQIRMF